MQKLHASITINAPREKVWNTMLSDDTYRQWTAAFYPGSHFRGEWKEGAKMLFIGPSENGEEGMVSIIEACRPYEFVSIRHIGIYSNGVEDTESEKARQWSPAHENYSFTETQDGTTVSVEMDIQDEYKESFKEMWDKALVALKDIAEQ